MPGIDFDRLRREIPMEDVLHLIVGGQQNSAGLVGVVEGNDRGLMVGNLGRADHDRTGWVACCGRGIKVERNKQR